MMSNLPEKLWNKCLEVIKDNISEASYNTWFTPIIPLQYDKNVFVLQVPSQFFVEYIEEKYIDLLRMTLYRVVGNGTRLEYRVMIDQTTVPEFRVKETMRNQSLSILRLITSVPIISPVCRKSTHS